MTILQGQRGSPGSDFLQQAQSDDSPSVLVGMVDTGIDFCAGSPGFNALREARGFGWDSEADEVTVLEAADALGHGSALADTILALAPASKILMGQVFFEQWRTRPAQVAAAIDWLCASGAQLINLSLGLRADRAILHRACDEALARGVILVASTPARGQAVFPAAYPGVIRATGDARCAGAEWSWLDSAEADVGSCVYSMDNSVVGASAGAACVTAHIARYLHGHPAADGEQVMLHLRSQASYHGPEQRRSRNN